MPPRASSRPGAAPARPRRWWRRHPILTATFGLLLLFVVGATVDLLRIRADIDAGQTALSDLTLQRLSGGLVETIGGAADRIERADDIADRSPFLAPLSILPVLGGQVDAIRDLTEVAERIGRSADQASLAIDEDLQRAGREPAARLDLLATVAAELDRIEAEVADLEVGAEGLLIGPLSSARRDLVEELDTLPERFEEARGHIDSLATLLRGPSRYLVLAANNAEMRGGAGMPLSGGVLTFLNGDVNFGEFEPLANRHVPGVPELVPEEYVETYHNFKVGRSWLQTAVSPNFPATAPIYAGMSAQFPLGPVDGVLEVDAVVLGELLSVIGPVELGGITYTAENIVAEVLNGNYIRFGEATQDARSQRLEVQGDLAATIFDALKHRDVEVADLALRLQGAAQGRHLLAYAKDPAVQELWESVGATGELNPSGLMVTVQNIAANKLDWYIQPEVTIKPFRRVGDSGWKIRLTVAVENPVRDQASDHVESWRDEPEYQNGAHRALVAVYLPEAAFDIYSRDRHFTEAGWDGPLKMVGKRSFIAEGDTETFSIDFSLPEEQVGALILPSGRAHPVEYHMNGFTVTDAVTTPVIWEPPVLPGPRSSTPIIAAFLALVGAACIGFGVRTRLQPTARGAWRAAWAEPARFVTLGLVLFATSTAVLAASALVSAVA